MAQPQYQAGLGKDNGKSAFEAIERMQAPRSSL